MWLIPLAFGLGFAGYKLHKRSQQSSVEKAVAFVKDVLTRLAAGKDVPIVDVRTALALATKLKATESAAKLQATLDAALPAQGSL